MLGRLKTVGLLVLAVILTAALGAGGSFVLGGVGVRGALAAEAVLALAVTTAAALVGIALQRRSLAALGLPRAHAARDFARGALVGAGLISGVVAILALAGRYAVVAVRFDGGALARSLVLMLLVAWFEEVLFRGLVFRLLEEAAGSIVALVLSAAFFGAVHAMNPHATIVASIAIALEAGVLLGAAYLRTRALWLPIGLHFAWNFFEGPILGAPVSGSDVRALLVAEWRGPVWLDGGAFGPEAGIVAVVVCSLTAAWWLARAWREGRFIGWRR